MEITKYSIKLVEVESKLLFLLMGRNKSVCFDEMDDYQSSSLAKYGFEQKKIDFSLSLRFKLRHEQFKLNYDGNNYC